MLLFCFRVQTGLGIAIMLIGFELLTFLMGITMFLPSAAMICILLHYKSRKEHTVMWLKVVQGDHKYMQVTSMIIYLSCMIL
jgi:hypothetical protein